MPTTEFYILEGSKLVGKKLGYIQDEYKVTIDHIHNPTLSPKTATEPDMQKEIKPRLYVKVVGSSENIRRVLRDAQ